MKILIEELVKERCDVRSGAEVGEKPCRVGLSFAMIWKWKTGVLVMMYDFVAYQVFDVSEART